MSIMTLKDPVKLGVDCSKLLDELVNKEAPSLCFWDTFNKIKDGLTDEGSQVKNYYSAKFSIKEEGKRTIQMLNDAETMQSYSFDHGLLVSLEMPKGTAFGMLQVFTSNSDIVDIKTIEVKEEPNKAFSKMLVGVKFSNGKSKKVVVPLTRQINQSVRLFNTVNILYGYVKENSKFSKNSRDQIGNIMKEQVKNLKF